MALIEKYHVVAAFYPVHTGEEIIEGMWVKLNASGEAILATGASGEYALGVAGDTKSVSTSGIPGGGGQIAGGTGAANNAHIGAVDYGGTGETNQFVNRLSDSFDETKASGKVTVYFAGGEFATNQYETDAASSIPGDPLYVSSDSKLQAADSASAQIVARLTKAADAFESGVPGLDVRGSMTLGNYLEFKMVI